jgi:hypothetical protein
MGQDSTEAVKGWPMGHNRPDVTTGDDLCHLAEIALALETWPARNPVMRAALDRARDELLRLAQGVEQRP